MNLAKLQTLHWKFNQDDFILELYFKNRDKTLPLELFKSKKKMFY